VQRLNGAGPCWNVHHVAHQPRKRLEVYVLQAGAVAVQTCSFLASVLLFQDCMRRREKLWLRAHHHGKRPTIEAICNKQASLSCISALPPPWQAIQPSGCPTRLLGVRQAAGPHMLRHICGPGLRQRLQIPQLTAQRTCTGLALKASSSSSCGGSSCDRVLGQVAQLPPFVCQAVGLD
jgi:hypothetical protein